VRARNGRAFHDHVHAANALEQRFLSRVLDRRRAISGRSPMQAALHTALSSGTDHHDAIDLAPAVEDLVQLRHELRLVSLSAAHLTYDQRLVLASQLAGMRCQHFCHLHHWTPEKYRKVGQRARAKLRRLVDERDVPPRPPTSDNTSEPCP
jgi:hypothetical protein